MQSLQKDLDKYIKTVDAANESGQQLIKEILDEPTITKEDMDKLNCAWEELCQQSVDKQDRLNEALTAAEKFEEGYSDIISWVNSEVSILQSQSEPDEDATILLQQIEDNNVHVLSCTYIDTCMHMQYTYAVHTCILEMTARHYVASFIKNLAMLALESYSCYTHGFYTHGFYTLMVSIPSWFLYPRGFYTLVASIISWLL